MTPEMSVQLLVLDGFPELNVHPDVPAGMRALADGGLRIVTLTNGSLSQSEVLLDRAGIADPWSSSGSPSTTPGGGSRTPTPMPTRRASAASRSSAARWWPCTPGT